MAELLMLPHPLTSFEIQKYQNEIRFNGVYSRNNLPVVPICTAQIRDGAYVISFDK